MKIKNNYDKDSIQSLNPREFTRLKSELYAGDTTNANQLLIEVIANSVDEFRVGHGEKIEVTIDKDIVTVTDYGQGFLVNSVREDGKTILEAAFSVLNTSGKYSEEGVYEGNSLGAFGIGLKICCFLTHWLEVETFRDGEYEFLRFEEGILKKTNTGKSDRHSGTIIRWQPSEEFFTSTLVDIKHMSKIFKTLTCLCKGLTITLDDNSNETVFYSENGIDDLLDDFSKQEILKNRLKISESKEKNSLDLAMTYTENYSSSIIPYVNTGLTESGVHISAFKSILTREMNKFYREQGWLKEKDENLSGEDIQEGLCVVFNIIVPNVSYDAQVKNKVVKIDTTYFTATLVEKLQDWCQQNDKEIKKIADKAIASRKAREAAKKAKEKVRNGEKTKRRVLKVDSKFADCYGKDRSKCELFILEGQSASGGMKNARDNETQAILPIRGKIINCISNKESRVSDNKEVQSIINAIGLYLNPITNTVEFDESKLRYGKILICADADVDGSHIQSLLYSFIWKFFPQLLERGYVYASIPPLYKIIKDKSYEYLLDDKALAEYKKINPDTSKYIVKRNKGIGEMDSDELEESLINPAKRTIKKITVEDFNGADELFNHLMGSVSTYRKDYIEKNSYMVSSDY